MTSREKTRLAIQTAIASHERDLASLRHALAKLDELPDSDIDRGLSTADLDGLFEVLELEVEPCPS